MEDHNEHHGEGPAPHEPVPLDDRPLAGGAPTSPDTRWWNAVDERHQRLILAAVVAGVIVLAVGIGVGVALLGQRLSEPGEVGGPATTTPAAATSSVPATVAPSPGATTTPEVVTPTATPGPAVREPFVAYRLDGAVWVAKEDGSGAKRAMTSDQGPFSLSPDGATLAVVDADSQTLTLVDIASGHPTVVGAAVPERPGWAPDSSFVVYSTLASTSHDTEIDRVDRDGSGHRTLGGGSGAQVAPDGSVVAVSASMTSTGTPIVVYAGGAGRLLGRAIFATAVAPGKAGIFFADAGGVAIQATKRPPSLQTIAYGGVSQRTIVSKPVATGVFFDDLAVSPDGVWIAYTETGDDGYSRMFAVRSAGGARVALSPRRDDYVLGWSATGSEILFVEGNQTQEEKPRVMAVRPDGLGRRIVVDGGGL